MFRIGFSFFYHSSDNRKKYLNNEDFLTHFLGLAPRNMGSVPKMRYGNCGDGGDKRRAASRLGDVMKRPKRVLYF